MRGCSRQWGSDRSVGAAWALCVASTLVCSTAIADDSNFRPYLLGARAAGMGGAFTALADDGSGSFYNPGGLAFTQRSSISLSGSIYGVVRARSTSWISTVEQLFLYVFLATAYEF